MFSIYFAQITLFPSTALNMCKCCLWNIYIVFNSFSLPQVLNPFKHLLCLCHSVGFAGFLLEKIDRPKVGYNQAFAQSCNSGKCK